MEVTLELVGFAIILLFAVVIYLAWRYRAPDHSAWDAPRDPLVITDEEVSPAHDAVVKKIGTFVKNGSNDVHVARRQMEDLFFREVDARIVPVDVAGVPGEWVLAEGADPDKRLLYLHGGGFRFGSPRSHRHITYELSRRSGVAVLALDYRMQPEFKTTACHEDARTAYRWILENGPDAVGGPKAFFIAGDSAGGNLTLSAIAWARDTGRRAVDGAIAFAPLTDATFSSPTWASNKDTDPFLGPTAGQLLRIPRFVIALASRLSSGKPANDPMLSPLLGHLNNLPGTLIQVSRDEMLYGDAQRYANKAREQGSDVTLQVWPKMVHVFQGFQELPESDAALALASAFITSRAGIVSA